MKSPEAKLDLVNRKILIVNDNAWSTRQIKQALKSVKCFHPWLITSGEEVLSQYKQHLFDIIIMNLELPMLNGTKIAQKIRKLEKKSPNKLPIIIIGFSKYHNRFDQETIKNWVLDHGMNAYVDDAYNQQSLLQTIENCIAEQELTCHKLLKTVNNNSLTSTPSYIPSFNSQSGFDDLDDLDLDLEKIEIPEDTLENSAESNQTKYSNKCIIS